MKIDLQKKKLLTVCKKATLLITKNKTDPMKHKFTFHQAS